MTLTAAEVRGQTLPPVSSSVPWLFCEVCTRYFLPHDNHGKENQIKSHIIAWGREQKHVPGIN